VIKSFSQMIAKKHLMRCSEDYPNEKGLIQAGKPQVMRNMKRKVIVRYMGSNSTLGEEDCFRGNKATMSYKCHSLTAIVYRIKASVFKSHIDRNITAKEILQNQIKMRD